MSAADEWKRQLSIVRQPAPQGLRQGSRECNTKRSTSDIAERVNHCPAPEPMTGGVSARGSWGRILCIQLRSVHLAAHFFHLTENTKGVVSENLFDVRRAIAAIE